MQLIDNEHIVAFDIDETIFMHGGDIFDENTVYITNPYSNSEIHGSLNKNHYELLKQYKARGMFVIFWSKAGMKWAEAVIKEFQLESYVDLVMTKLDKYVDDLEAPQILGERVYIK